MMTLRTSGTLRVPAFSSNCGEDIMRIVAGVVAATALIGAASAAYAANPAIGDIKSLNRGAHMLTLDNGSTFIAPRTAKLSNFKVGERVRVAYSVRGWGLGPQHATSIRPVGNNADLGG
jgi:hypothetical protein